MYRFGHKSVITLPTSELRSWQGSNLSKSPHVPITGVARRLAKERRRKPQNGNMVYVQMMCRRRDDNREAKLKKKEYHERKQQVGTEKLSTVTRHISSLLSSTRKEAVLGNARRVLISHPRGRKRFCFLNCAFSSVAPNLRVCVNLYACSVRVKLKKKEQHVMQMPWLAQCSTTAVFLPPNPQENGCRATYYQEIRRGRQCRLQLAAVSVKAGCSSSLL